VLKFKAIHIVTENNVENIVNETERPWDWFPELEKFCTDEFQVKELVLDLDLDVIKNLRDSIQRISFKIEKLSN